MSGRVSTLAFLFCVIAGLMLGGCGRKETLTADIPNTSRVGAIQYAYLEASQKLKRPPAKVEEIRPYLQKLGNPDELLVSPRDGKPYVIVWGLDLEKGYGEENPVFI